MTVRSEPLQIAFLLDHFPILSQTFILRQITSLLDLGHGVDIYAEWSCADPLSDHADALVHPEVHEYRLLERTTYVDMPLEAGYWGLPIVPLTGRTWLPGSNRWQLNAVRAARALPHLLRCFATSTTITRQLLDDEALGADAHTLAPIYRMAALAKRRYRRYDALHAHFGPVGDRFRFARRLFGSPFVVSFYGYDFSSWPHSKGKAVYHSLFADADAIAVLSQHAGGRLEELGCPSEKIRHLPLGVDVSAFPFRKRARTEDHPVRLLTVARLVEKKGLEFAIRAFAAAREKDSRIRYDIVGEGPLKNHLIELIHSLGAADAVTLHGALDSVETRRMMDEADIFVLASVTGADGNQEGTPVVLMEAQACGLPVISTRHSGIPEVVLDGQSGLLVPERDADALCAALIQLLARPESWPEMGRRGRAHIAENHDIRKLAHQQVTLYRELQRAG